jgi:toxin ParE1/3/4
MEIRWSPQAAEDLERIARRILRDNPAAAREVVETLYNGITNLKTFPNRGRAGRIEGSRELVFPSLPYIVVYRLKDQAVEIARIYHAAQDWP